MNGVDLAELGKKIARRIYRTGYAYVAWPVWLIRGGLVLGCVLWLRRYGRHRLGARPVSMENPPTVVMLVVTALDRDPRVERGARTLAANGFKVTVICPAWRGASPRTAAQLDWGPGVTFRILPRRAARFAFYFPYLFGGSMLRAAMREPAWAYHAHDLTTALIGLAAAARKRAACVCDFHEWYSENVTYHRRSQTYRPHPPLKRRLFQAVERVALHTATGVITVCESIAEDLEKRFQAPKPVHVIRNIPFLRPVEPGAPPYEALRDTLGIAADTRIVLYQGGLGPSRNLEPVIKAMADVPGAVLVIRGPEHDVYGPAYQELARRVGVRERVYCLGPVPSDRVVEAARAGDLGLWTLLANVGLNFHYALGNKIFEYLAAGLPLLVADLPEARRLVQRYHVGLCFDPDSPASIAAAINRMVQDHGFREVCQANIPLALQAMQADQEWAKLVNLYRHLMRPR
jgi:glycosyltransferase involved in cell wall biosynthesis